MASKFHKHSVADLARVTPVSMVTDREIWSHLVTPMVRALLGPIDFESSRIQVLETTKGLFPGDEVTNLKDHRLYGGQAGFIRFPYLHSFYKTENGAFIVKRDGVKFEAIGWYGDVMKGRGELIFKAALRDRRHDGTARANDCSLVEFVGYDDPQLNRPLPAELASAEISVYGFQPGSRVAASCGDPQLDLFIEKPFTFLDRPELFLSLFRRAWNSQRAPGQNAAAIPDVSRLVSPQFDAIAKKHRYDVLEAAPSHYHVAMWARSLGYQFTDPTQAKVFNDLGAGIGRIKAAGISLNRAQESWVCVIQSLRPVELIPTELYLHGPVWPQDNIGPQNLWMNKPLSDKAKKLLAK